jgi:hypothetical protein
LALSVTAKKKQNASGRTGMVVFFLFAIIILCTAFFIYLKSRTIDFASVNIKTLFTDISTKKTGSTYSIVAESEFHYDVMEHPVFCVYMGSIVKCRADSLTFLDKMGNEVWKTSVSFSGRPVLKVAGSYLMAADLGGKNIYVIRNNSVIWVWNAEKRIINADISENGLVSVIQEVNGYKASVSVYKSGSSSPLIFTRNIAENYLLNAKLSPTGSQIVLNRLDSAGISLSTDLEFNNLSSVKPFANIRKNDEVYPDILFFDDGSLLAAGDMSAVLFDKGRNEKWKADYQGRNMLGVCMCMGKYAVIAALQNTDKGGSENKSEITIINSSGQEYASCSMDGRVLNVAASDGIIAANKGNAVYFFHLKGEPAGEYNSMAEIKEVYFLNNLEAAIIVWGKIIVVKLV